MLKCEYCNRELPDDEIASRTSFYGCYCLDCLELVLKETGKRITELNFHVNKKHCSQNNAVKNKKLCDEELSTLLAGSYFDSVQKIIN